MALDGNIKCPHHGKLLEYYCLDDMTCVCVSCAIEDQHRLHNMKTFPTAHKELTEKLRAEQQVLKEKTDDDNKSLEKWEKREREKLARCSVRLVEAVTNLRDASLTRVQSSVSGRMVSIRTSLSSMQAAQKETDTFRFLQMYSQVHQDVEKAKAVDLRRGLEPGKDRDELVQEIRQNGEKMVKQGSQFVESLFIQVDPENHQEPLTTGSDLIFEPQGFVPSMSLSKDKRKIFYHSWLGQCSATVLISSTQSAPNFQRWVVSLTKDTDWMVGLCDKQSTNNLKEGPVYGLFCEDNRLGYLTTKYDDCPAAPSISEEEDGIIICNQMSVSSVSLTHQGEDGNESVPRPEKVEVLWNFIGSTLSFFNRTGQYQRSEEIITIKMSHNNRSLAPFVQLGVENTQSRPPQNWQCSCGQVYIRDTQGYRRDTQGYRRKQFSDYMVRCSCGTTVGSPCVTVAVCELLQ